MAEQNVNRTLLVKSPFFRYLYDAYFRCVLMVFKDPNPFINYRVRSRVYEKGTLISAEESKPSKGMVTTNSRVVANVHPVELGTENRLFRDSNEVS